MGLVGCRGKLEIGKMGGLVFCRFRVRSLDFMVNVVGGNYWRI